jgi:hypothetical protein
MKISDVIVAFTPNRPEYPSGFRGKMRIFPAGTAEADLAPFAERGGRPNPRAHDSRREVREAYAVGLGNLMMCRDGLDPQTVHEALLVIDEYRSGHAFEAEHPEHSEEH